MLVWCKARSEFYVSNLVHSSYRRVTYTVKLGMYMAVGQIADRTGIY